MDRHLTDIQINTEVSADKTNEIKRYNRSIFLPSFSFFGKKSRKKKEEKKNEEAFKERMQKKEEVRSIIYESKQRTVHHSRSTPCTSQLSSASSLRTQDTIQSDEESDETERGIQDNLSIMSDSIGKLKAMSIAMSEEIELQNDKLKSLGDKTSDVNAGLSRVQYKIKSIR
jgi:hypothetical protein